MKIYDSSYGIEHDLEIIFIPFNIFFIVSMIKIIYAYIIYNIIINYRVELRYNT